MFYIIIIFGIVIIMERANINGTELEFTIKGTGEPVILIHGAIIADANLSFNDAVNSYRKLSNDTLSSSRLRRQQYS